MMHHNVIIDGITYIPLSDQKYKDTSRIITEEDYLNSECVFLNQVPEKGFPILLVIPNDCCDYNMGTVNIKKLIEELKENLQNKKPVKIKYGLKKSN